MHMACIACQRLLFDIGAKSTSEFMKVPLNPFFKFTALPQQHRAAEHAVSESEQFALRLVVA